MYENFDFETFINSISVMTGFTTDQIKTLLAYRDVKYLDETTAADLTAELTKLKDEMIKANPTGFEIKRPQTPLFPLEHIEEVAGVLSLEELLLMVFIDCPNIKIAGDSKIRPAVMGHRMQLAASLYERGLVSYKRAIQLSGKVSRKSGPAGQKDYKLRKSGPAGQKDYKPRKPGPAGQKDYKPRSSGGN